MPSPHKNGLRESKLGRSETCNEVDLWEQTGRILYDNKDGGWIDVFIKRIYKPRTTEVCGIHQNLGDR